MATKRVFISFDFDNDADLRGNLVAQAGRRDSPFSIVDWSLKEPYDENWKRKVRYQLLTVTAAALTVAEHRAADRAVVIVHEFVTSETRARKRQRNSG